MRQLDGRSSLSQSIAKYRAELLSSLGGAENLSAMELTILETCSRDWILLQSIDAYILQTGAFNKKRRQAYPLTVQRMQIADSLTRRLQALGLQRRSKVLSLSDYLSTNGTAKPSAPASSSPASTQVPSMGGTENSQEVGVQEVQQATNEPTQPESKEHEA